MLHLVTMGCLLATHAAACVAVSLVPPGVMQTTERASAALTALLWGLVASLLVLIFTGTRLRGRSEELRVREDLFPLAGIGLRRGVAAAAALVPPLLLPLVLPPGDGGWAGAAFCNLASMGVLWAPLFTVGLTSSRLAAQRRRAEVAADAGA